MILQPKKGPNNFSLYYIVSYYVVVCTTVYYVLLVVLSEARIMPSASPESRSATQAVAAGRGSDHH